jgi:hypothetical protein
MQEKGVPGRGSGRVTARRWIAPTFGAVVGVGLLGVGVGSADPSIPGTPGYCGAHTGALDCYADTSPPTPAEMYFVKTTGPQFAKLTTAQLVQYARGTCVELRGGDVTSFVVKDLATHIGSDMEAAGQVMDGAMAADCPNLTVGPDGVAR